MTDRRNSEIKRSVYNKKAMTLRKNGRDDRSFKFYLSSKRFIKSIIVFYLTIRHYIILMFKITFRFFNFTDGIRYRKLRFSGENSPRILHLSTSDISGGAARAAHSIHSSLVKKGFSSLMGVMTKKGSSENFVFQTVPHGGFLWITQRIKNFAYRRFLRGFRPRSHVLYSFQLYSSFNLSKLVKILKPDIIHLHWICHGFIGIENLKELDVKIVWTMHDMWPFCSAEHISFDDMYLKGYDPAKCGKEQADYWGRKKEAYRNLKIHSVGVSRWITEQAKQSVLLNDKPASVIPNILNTEVFYPREKNEARNLFSFGSDRRIVLFGSDYKDENKGYDIVEKIILEFEAEKRMDTAFAVFGRSSIKIDTEYVKIYNLGFISGDERLSFLYSAADVTLVPSKIESFCLTAAESVSCGTPVVSFDTSGLKDIVENDVTGFRSRPFEYEDFKSQMERVLMGKKSYEFNREKMHLFIKERFGEDSVAAQYSRLYKEILNEGQSDEII